MLRSGRVEVRACDQGVRGSYRADVHVVQGGGLQPLPQEVLLHAGLGLEDGHGDGSDGETTATRLQAEEPGYTRYQLQP